jgi:hypothetical protein
MIYLPLWLNFTSEIEEIISEKNDLLLGSSGSSKTAEQKQKMNLGQPRQRTNLFGSARNLIANLVFN